MLPHGFEDIGSEIIANTPERIRSRFVEEWIYHAAQRENQNYWEQDLEMAAHLGVGYLVQCATRDWLVYEQASPTLYARHNTALKLIGYGVIGRSMGAKVDWVTVGLQGSMDPEKIMPQLEGMLNRSEDLDTTITRIFGCACSLANDLWKKEYAHGG